MPRIFWTTLIVLILSGLNWWSGSTFNTRTVHTDNEAKLAYGVFGITIFVLVICLLYIKRRTHHLFDTPTTKDALFALATIIGSILAMMALFDTFLAYVFLFGPALVSAPVFIYSLESIPLSWRDRKTVPFLLLILLLLLTTFILFATFLSISFLE